MYVQWKCKKCGHGTARIVKWIINNGTYQVWRQCCMCEQNVDGTFIKHDSVRAVWDKIPTIEYPYADYDICAVSGCDEIYTERHHFAPRHLFDDCEHWPSCHLCKKHHDEWHNVVTPDMCRGKE